ncbi:GNAT-family acetyltransferase TIGR03103 [Tistlia consotensis]|uniref:GNAT-family acetyltransferase TIGR03103 n=1 Tax=Tistlia consotensis USBA 355 TaxID=560819 RepID=A0A1Y6BRI9_9PROT|nr:N-acetylglutaminylglutamine synthetase [Tistlia consotensis]SMF16252.1 GNAT-family acetyltransferase TIGR03103 [Tistlia consotensis USBA 355]SNR41292.1 GNAT-family acetyltransferase TIGR03103 [Tistlia consotensis]
MLSNASPSAAAAPHSAPNAAGATARNVSLDCGWGRLLFGQSFDDHAGLLEELLREKDGCRDIAFYVSEPHVVQSMAPQQVFLDPSHAFRLRLAGLARGTLPPTCEIYPVEGEADAKGVNRCYSKAGMVRLPEGFLLARRDDERFIHLVARDLASGEIIGSVTGLDHVEIFGDPEQGASLWCLVVDPQAPYPGVGEALVRDLGRRLRERGREQLDLSVLYDNRQAIGLYEKLGFERLPVFAMKTRNQINEVLFAGPEQPDIARLNPYAQIIVDEARRRGIHVEVLDAEGGFFRLVHGGRSIVCREALSELTTAVAMSRCDDKAVTSRLLAAAGLKVPAQRRAGTTEENAAFLERYGRLVVKPLRGEQGRGVYVDLTTIDEVERAVADARRFSEQVLMEEYVKGEDLRIIVIDYKVVAAAIRRPAEVTGTGKHTIRELIEAQSRRRAAATGGESRIPIDAETRRCVESYGYGFDDLLEEGRGILVRKTANLHTGGTIHDVTDRLHTSLRSAAEEAARALGIPVVGLDFLVPSAEQPKYAIVEANERPGLANHEPAPTAERFVDLLFPQTAA